MSSSTKVLDPAFQGVGQQLGIEIWRIENFQPVPLPKPDYGKFYTGDSYLILQTTQAKGGTYFYDIHFWIGKDTSQDEAGTAAIKTVELDASLGGRAVQHREIQGHESDKFLSYFKPCIIPLEGGVASGFRKPEEEEFETRLYICKGKRVVRMKQVPFARSSLNHEDVFILDTQNKIYQFNGANSNIQERAKALEVVQFLKEKYHEGMCEVAIVDDGRLDTESDSGEFWALFGGFAPIGKKAICEDDVIPEAIPAQLYNIVNGEVRPVEGELSKSLLENKKCYILDCGAEVFLWVGRATQVEERKSACQAVEEFLVSHNRPKATKITRVIQGFETLSFRSNFDSWPTGTTAATAEKGKGKVAAFLKQQVKVVKGTTKSTIVNEEIPHLLEGGGKMEVWRIDGGDKDPLPKEDIGKFYSGDCYIVLYSYHTGERKEDYFLCCWFGKDSVEEDQRMATQLADKMFNSLKGRPVQGRIFEGKEPQQFVALFQPMVILKGGLSSSYKQLIADKELADTTYTAECVALIQVSGTYCHNHKAVQVDAVAKSLSSTECFLLQTGPTIYLWHGSQSSPEKEQVAAKVADLLKPGVDLKHLKETTKNIAFWSALGGKQNYVSKKVADDTVRDPHLFTFSFNKGKFQVEEIYNFSQDDLLTEDMLILDTRGEVFIWVGQTVDSKEKQSAFEIGQKYIDLAASLEGLSPRVPLYKVTEGNEPCFFTAYFSWDHAKATVQGNSFQKKAALLFGVGHAVEDKSNGYAPKQRAEALAALNSAFNSSAEKTHITEEYDGSGPRQRAEALAALNSAFNSSPEKTHITEEYDGSGPRQRAEALAALNSAFNSSSEKTHTTGEYNGSGPRQRAEALAALNSAFNSSSEKKLTTSQDRLNELNHGGPRQRAEALAALTSAFSSSSSPKAVTSKLSATSQGSQRAAAVAALSSVLTNEKRQTPDSTPVGSPLAGNITPGLEEDEDAKEPEELAQETGGDMDSEPKQENLDDDILSPSGGATYSYDQLKNLSENSVSGIDFKRREAYLSDDDFLSVFGKTKEAFYMMPKWKQDLLKKKQGLF